jgi:hypothetical protein
MDRCRALAGVSATGYAPHALHAGTRTWVETNCYADAWIEVLHALRLEPAAVFPFTVAVDFEGDHWTFFKPPLADLRALYGIDVQELNVWRALVEHAAEHLAAGKLLATEADAFWLPDTAGTDYRQQHVKTTIVLNELDPANLRLGYFHNAGYFNLEGEDFRRTLRIDGAQDPAALPLYAELIRIDRLLRRPATELARISAGLLRDYLALRPASNPVRRFAQRVDAELSLLRARGLPHYHVWAFATVRQLGAAFALAADNLRWLASHDHAPLAAAAGRFELIAQDAKLLILKLARVVNTGRAFDPGPAFAPMAQAWEEGMELIAQAARIEPCKNRGVPGTCQPIRVPAPSAK